MCELTPHFLCLTFAAATSAVNDLVKMLSDENVDLQTNTLKLINALLTNTSTPQETERRYKMLTELGIDRIVNSKYVRMCASISAGVCMIRGVHSCRCNCCALALSPQNQNKSVMLDQEVQTFSQIIASITDGVTVSASDVRQVR